MLMYSLSIPGLIARLIPATLRKPIHLAWLGALCAPISSLWLEFSHVYTDMLTYVGGNITTNNHMLRLTAKYPDITYSAYVYTEHSLIPDVYAQYIPEHLRVEYDYFETEVAATQNSFDYFTPERDIDYDYTVIIPTQYNLQIDEIKHYLSLYCPVGKRYRLVFQDIILA